MRAGKQFAFGVAVLAVLLCGLGLWLFKGQKTPDDLPEQQTQQLRLFVFDCGYIFVKDIAPFSVGTGLSGPKQLVNSCFLIQHPQGMLMWDAGLSDDLLGQAQERKNLRLEVRKSLVEQFKAIDVNPEDVEFLAFSHLHFDHVGNAKLFKNARWLIQADEYAAAYSEVGRKQGFARKYYAALKQNPVQILEGDYDVFGDGKVTILSAPGHTIGHQMLLVKLEKTGPVLLSGDLYHFAENRQMAAMPNFNFDAAQTAESMRRVEQLLAASTARLLIQHDAAIMATVPYAPAWLD